MIINSYKILIISKTIFTLEVFMSTPPNSSTANADSLAQLTALQAAANALFIDQANTAIENAINEGKYWIVLTSFQNCNLLDLQTYFVGLGYQVQYPDMLNPNLTPQNPAQLFGQDLVDFWDNGGQVQHLSNPLRIKLLWQIP